MKRSLTLAGALIGAAALTLSGCAQAPGTDTPSAAPSGEHQCQRLGWRLQGLHGLRLRWLRRQGVQPDLVQGPDRRQDRAGHRDRRGRVADRLGLRQEHPVDGRRQLQHHRHRRLPAQRRHPRRRQEEHRHQVRHRRQQRPEDLPGGQEPQAAGLQHRAVQLHGRLPGRGDDQDQEGRHLRRGQDPHRDDLHGRLLPGRGLLQQDQERPASRCSAGTRPSRTVSSCRATSRSTTRGAASVRPRV